MSGNLIKIATFSHIIDAQPAKTKLELKGIECFIVDERILSKDWLYPYVVGGIMIATAIEMGSRYYYNKRFTLPKCTHLINMNYYPMLDPISYRMHNILENKGPVLEIADPLTINSVLDILEQNDKMMDLKVSNSIKPIHSVLKQLSPIDMMSGIYIHGNTEGYVLIKGPKRNGNHIVSIRI